MTIREAYTTALQQLQQQFDQRESSQLASILLEDLWGIRNCDSDVEFTQVDALADAIRRLTSGEPVQHITGITYFYGYRFQVSEHVLIPRPETEELVYWIESDYKRYTEPLSILDIGTGSGCIPISLALKLPNANISAIDKSAKALKVAKQNAMSLDATVDFTEVDFLDESQWAHMDSYDVIVSNPPYIGHDEQSRMGQSVVMHEPSMALFPDGDDPLIFYKKIASFGQQYLKPRGAIYLEINEYYPEETLAIFDQVGYTTELLDDLQGKPRMIKAWR